MVEREGLLRVRFCPFAKPSRKSRFLRKAVVHARIRTGAKEGHRAERRFDAVGVEITAYAEGIVDGRGTLKNGAAH
jgi:hypothetical protein